MSLASPLKLSEPMREYGPELDRQLVHECFARAKFSTAAMPVVVILWWYITGDAVNKHVNVRAAYLMLLVLPMLRAIAYSVVMRASESRVSTRGRFWVYVAGASVFGGSIGAWTYVVEPFLDPARFSLVSISIAALDVIALVNTCPAPLAYLGFLLSSLTPSLVVIARGPASEMRTMMLLEIAIYFATLCVLALRVHVSLRDALLLTLQLRDVALRDPLTGLPNRRALMEHALRASLVERRKSPPVGQAVLMIDLDHFKSVNDTHGHEAGDVLLKRTADALRACLRTGDIVARWGGEEFVVTASGVPRTVALAIAERIRQYVEQQAVTVPDGAVLKRTCSIGLCWLSSENGNQVVSMLRAADAALYRAKRLGRNRVVEARPEDFEPPVARATSALGFATNV